MVFLRPLLRHARRKVFLIVDEHAVAHGRRGGVVGGAPCGRLGLFLHGYSPALNPEKFLNQDVKTNAVGRQRPSDKGEFCGQRAALFLEHPVTESQGATLLPSPQRPLRRLRCETFLLPVITQR